MKKKAIDNKQTGVGLIEVLVSVLVIAIGLLGTLGLQLSGKQSNHEAVARSSAVFAVEDIISRIRINPDGVTSSAYTTAGVGGGSLGDAPGTDCGTTTSTCSSTLLAAWDLWQWEQTLDGVDASSGGASVGGLVNPTGCISINGDLVTVVIAWQGKVALDQTGMPACGDDKYGTDDEFRQVSTLTTFIFTG
jgi:type IV pilus assembly protein PilV